MRLRAAAVALALLAACSGSPNARPKTKAHATTTTASTTSTTASSSTTTAATATTASTALAKPCSASDLGVDEIQGDGASQHNLVSVGLRNVSSFTCSLSGFPTSFTAVDQDGKALDHFDQGAYQPDPPPGDVIPGASGVVIIDTKTACYDASGNETHPPTRMFKNIQIGVPGGGTLSLGDYVINGTCGVAVSKLGVHK